MNIYIDFASETPSAALQKRMNSLKLSVLERLSPIENEMKNSQGMLVLHIDGSFEVKETPYKLHVKIQELIGPFSGI